jgi:hypothetical protein
MTSLSPAMTADSACHLLPGAALREQKHLALGASTIRN